MSATTFNDLKNHVGHEIICVLYGEEENVALECQDCGEILLDFDDDEDE